MIKNIDTLREASLALDVLERRQKLIATLRACNNVEVILNRQVIVVDKQSPYTAQAWTGTVLSEPCLDIKELLIGELLDLCNACKVELRELGVEVA